MKRRTRGLLAVAAAGATVFAGAAFGPAAIAAPADSPTSDSTAAQRLDNRPGPLTERQNERRKAAQKLILSGQAAPGEDGVVQLAEDKYYEASVTGTGRLFTILSEFGTEGSGKLGTTPGPLHNEIPEPDRTVNNSTHWIGRLQHAVLRGPVLRRGRVVRGLLHEAVVGQLHGRGRGERLGDGARQRVDLRRQQRRGLRRRVAVHRGLRQRLVRRAGRGRQVGRRRDQGRARHVRRVGPLRLRTTTATSTSPTDTSTTSRRCTPVRARTPAAARRARTRSGRTAGTSTPPTTALTGPAGREVRRRADRRHRLLDRRLHGRGRERRPRRVRARVRATTSACPTSTTPPAGRTARAFWTLMSSGSWLNNGADDIGTTPNYMGPWEKLQLGWLDYSVVSAGEGGSYTLSPAAVQVDGQEQALVIDVPDQAIETTYTAPASGHSAWWTSSADDLNTTLTRSLDLTGMQQGDGHGEGLVRHRGRLRLPLRRVQARRRRLDADRLADRRLDERQVVDAAVHGSRQRPGRLPLPLPERRRRASRRRVHRRHRREERRHHAALRRRRVGRERMDRGRRLQDQHRHRDLLGRPVLPRREPHVRRLRRDARGGSVPVQQGPHRSRTAWSTSRSRTACSCGRSTRPTATTTPSSTRATAWRSRWTLVR